MKHKKVYLSLIIAILLLLFLVIVKVTWTTFTARSQVAGSSFSTGRPELMLLKNVSQPVSPENLSSSVPGLSFYNLRPNWIDTMGVKLFNSGTVTLSVRLKNVLRSGTGGESGLSQKILVQVSRWEDNNHDGGWQAGETGLTLGAWKTMEQWASESFPLGEVQAEELLPLILTFKVNEIDNTFAGQTLSYDFIFDAQGAN